MKAYISTNERLIMSNKHRIIIGVVAIVAVLGAAVIYTVINANKSAAPAATSSTSSTSSSSSTTNNQNVASVITYDGNTFSLSVNTITAGSQVEVKNTSSSDLNFDSDPHPTHTDEPELNQGDIAPGQSKVFTITKKGTWGFHNHLDPTQHGSITVN